MSSVPGKAHGGTLEMTMGSGRSLASSVAISVAEASQVGDVRRGVAAVGQSVGLDELAVGRAGIVATEAATNILKHGRGGEVVISPLGHGESSGIEVLALDRGPGIPDVDKALAVGHSTAGTTGLGAMRRQSSLFELYTLPGRGTVILSRVWPREPPSLPVELGTVCVAKPGEAECGDAWGVEPQAGGVRFVVADGLGHGPLAREAALAVLQATAGRPPGAAQALEEAHRASRSTRGAAVAVAEVDFRAGEVHFAGFGNIAGVLIGPDRAQSMVSMSGTAGQGLPKAREFTYRFSVGTLIVMASDGLASPWSLEPYPALARRHPGLVAGVLYRDHSRRRDDVTVVAARLGGRS